MSHSDRKAADLARQNQQIAEGERKFQKMESDIYSKAGEDFQRSFFNMTRTERQMYGLRTKHYGSGTPSGKIRKKKIEWWSKCCKEEAMNYRSVHYGGSKPAEHYYRCRGCWHDCEVQKTKPRAKKGKRSS